MQLALETLIFLRQVIFLLAHVALDQLQGRVEVLHFHQLLLQIGNLKLELFDLHRLVVASLSLLLEVLLQLLNFGIEFLLLLLNLLLGVLQLLLLVL